MITKMISKADDAEGEQLDQSGLLRNERLWPGARHDAAKMMKLMPLPMPSR